ncbi:O-methyltransferase [[Clostridium] innocuum]|nr:O-methyltransferase [[Clostridium] innocuum]
MTLIEEMEAYAKAYDVPIMQKEGIDFMCAFLNEHKLTRILEIGSAIGYSAIRMAMLQPDIHVTTIERDEQRYARAVEFVERSGLQEQITLLYGDALETNVEGSYDMLFIDAAKAQYTRFFERYEPLLIQGGYVITDNLKFHGLVEHPETITSRNLRSLVRKIGNFVEYLKQREDYDTQFYDFGDGVGISRKK